MPLLVAGRKVRAVSQNDGADQQWKRFGVGLCLVLAVLSAGVFRAQDDWQAGALVVVWL